MAVSITASYADHNEDCNFLKIKPLRSEQTKLGGQLDIRAEQDWADVIGVKCLCRPKLVSVRSTCHRLRVRSVSGCVGVLGGFFCSLFIYCAWICHFLESCFGHYWVSQFFLLIVKSSATGKQRWVGSVRWFAQLRRISFCPCVSSGIEVGECKSELQVVSDSQRIREMKCCGVGGPHRKNTCMKGNYKHQN